jgi:hypothetical protein
MGDGDQFCDVSIYKRFDDSPVQVVKLMPGKMLVVVVDRVPGHPDDRTAVGVSLSRFGRAEVELDPSEVDVTTRKIPCKHL